LWPYIGIPNSENILDYSAVNNQIYTNTPYLFLIAIFSHFSTTQLNYLISAGKNYFQKSEKIICVLFIFSITRRVRRLTHTAIRRDYAWEDEWTPGGERRFRFNKTYKVLKTL